MDDAITRIHPDLPLCWEDADTLRVGFERAYARVPTPSAGVQRLIGALRSGVRSDGIAQEARRMGASPRETRELLAALSPALVVMRRTAPPADLPPPFRRPAALGAHPLLRTRLSDDGRAVECLREGLLSTGLCVFDEGTAGGAAADLVILVERYLEPLERAQRWLIDAVPHLLLRFTDRAIHVGPIVRAEGAPCHTCIALAMLAVDPALPTLAAQLYGKAPRSECAAGGHMAAALAGVFIRNWLAGRPEAHGTRAVIPVERGLVSDAPRFEAVLPHAECACGQ